MFGAQTAPTQTGRARCCIVVRFPGAQTVDDHTKKFAARRYREIFIIRPGRPRFFCCFVPLCGRSWPQDPAKRVGLYIFLRRSRVISSGTNSKAIFGVAALWTTRLRPKCDRSSSGCTLGGNIKFVKGRTSVNLEVWAAPGAPETLPKGWGLLPPPVARVSGVAGAAQTPKMTGFRSFNIF